MTIREFNEMVRGYRERESRTVDREAGWVTLLVNATGHLKNPITKEQILGRPSSPSTTKDSLKDRAEQARRKRIAERRERARNIRR